LQSTYENFKKSHPRNESANIAIDMVPTIMMPPPVIHDNEPSALNGLQGVKRAGMDRFASTDSWSNNSPPNSSRQPIVHSKSSIAAFDSPAVVADASSKTEGTESSDHDNRHSRNGINPSVSTGASAVAGDGAGASASKGTNHISSETVTASKVPVQKESAVATNEDRHEATDSLVKPLGSQHRTGPNRSVVSPESDRPIGKLLPIDPGKHRTVNDKNQPESIPLRSVTQGIPNDHPVTVPDRGVVGVPSAVSDVADDPEFEVRLCNHFQNLSNFLGVSFFMFGACMYFQVQRIVQQKENNLRQQLVMLQDLDEIAESSSFRTKLMTRVRSRIAEIERTLHSVSAKTRHEHQIATISNTGSDNSIHKKVELDETGAKADIHQLRQSRLKTLASSNQDEENISRDVEGLMKKMFFGIRTMVTEEQQDVAPALAVVLFNKAIREYRLFFICSFTLCILPCGTDGEGFPFRRNWSWIRGAIPAIRFCLLALRCGLIRHTFDHSSDYSDLCRAGASRVYINDIIAYLDSEDWDQQKIKIDEAVPSANNQAPVTGTVWDLFGAFSCASGMLEMTGRIMLNTLDSGVGSCTRAFTADGTYERVCDDPDMDFRLSTKDLPNASISFCKMLNSVYKSASWKESH
jgi:hypothetical protein